MTDLSLVAGHGTPQTPGRGAAGQLDAPSINSPAFYQEAQSTRPTLDDTPRGASTVHYAVECSDGPHTLELAGAAASVDHGEWQRDDEREQGRRRDVWPHVSGQPSTAGQVGLRSLQTLEDTNISVRRSSVFPSGGARQSIAPGAFQTAGVKDTRPLRNGAYQQACQANIGEYLANSRCPVAVNARLLSSPTLHDFIAVFKHLVSDFTTADSWSKKFEADALVVLRDLKYPGVGDISKTALGTPGSPTNWHQLLGMLNWLVELNRVSRTGTSAGSELNRRRTSNGPILSL